MKQHLKRMLCIASALVLTGGCLPDAHTLFSDSVLTANAENGGECGENIFWALENDVLTISGTGDMYDFAFQKTPWDSFRNEIRHLVIEDGVTVIRREAFKKCSALEDVTFPDTLTVIEERAFSFCEALKEITIPDSVTAIESSAFNYCTALTKVTIPKSLKNFGYRAFDDTAWLKTLQKKNPIVTVNGILIDASECEGDVTVPDGITAVADGAFRDCSRITKITLADSITEIGSEAFGECDLLTEIHLPANLKTISYYMLMKCSSLTSVTIPDSVTVIEPCAFEDCSSLKEITFPASVNQICYQALCNCASLRSVHIFNPECEIIGGPATICNIYDTTDTSKTTFTGSIRGLTPSTAQEYAEKWGYTFAPFSEAPKPLQTCGEGLTWKLEDGVLTISGKGDMTDYFYVWEDQFAPWYDQRESVEKIVLEEGVTSIGDYAFRGCSALKTIKIPEGIKSVGEAAFQDCSKLYLAYLSDGVESIGGLAFDNCRQLRSVRIPDSVTKIGGYAFRETPWLSKQQEETPLVIVNNIVVSGTACGADVTIPEGVTAIADFAFCDNRALTTIVLPRSMRTIGARAFEDCIWLNKITIPEGLTEIGVYAFEQANNLKSVSLPDSVTTISFGAFYLCRGLEKVTVPKHLTYLGEYAFATCLALKEIILPDTLTEIPKRAFWQCESLQKVSIPKTITAIQDEAFCGCTSLTAVSIPDAVQHIGADAFYACSSLAELTIPKRTTEIGGMAFRGTKWLAARQKENPLVTVNGILIDGSTCEGDVIIPNSVKTIADSAFEECSGVKRVKIAPHISAIGERTFALCQSLEEVWFMNPKCSIPESEDTVFNHYKSADEYDRILDGVIRGYADSTAQEYAAANHYKFQVIPPIHGDYNGDFGVSMADAVLLARFIAEHKTLADVQISRILAANPDYDGDGGVTISDVTVLLKKIAGS